MRERESLLERRERARSLATSIVSFAIMGLGLAVLILAIALAVRGSLPFIFLALMLGAIGVVVVFGGFFFHLLPSRIDALADEKREYDRRVAAGREGAEPGDGREGDAPPPPP